MSADHRTPMPMSAPSPTRHDLSNLSRFSDTAPSTLTLTPHPPTNPVCAQRPYTLSVISHAIRCDAYQRRQRYRVYATHPMSLYTRPHTDVEDDCPGVMITLIKMCVGRHDQTPAIRISRYICNKRKARKAFRCRWAKAKSKRRANLRAGPIS